MTCSEDQPKKDTESSVQAETEQKSIAESTKPASPINPESTSEQQEKEKGIANEKKRERSTSTASKTDEPVTTRRRSSHVAKPDSSIITSADSDQKADLPPQKTPTAEEAPLPPAANAKRGHSVSPTHPESDKDSTAQKKPKISSASTS